MNNKKIVFMGTPVIASEYLNFLINNNIKIEAVVTNPPKKQSRGMLLIETPVHLLAKKNNIFVFHPKKFDTEMISQLTKMNPDLIIVMAYGKMIPNEVLNLPKYGCINLHVSMLPRWRGAAPIEYTLLNGDKETGVSIIKLVEKLDSGPIIAQKKFDIPAQFNKEQLSNELTKIGTKLLVNTIPKILTNQIFLKKQNEEDVTYAKKISSEDRKINFNNSSIDIINQVRAHAPKPGAWFYLNRERIKIIDAKPGSNIGEISTILNKNFEIACKDGSIEPLVLQREGKNIVTKEDFLRGFKLKVNDMVNA